MRPQTYESEQELSILGYVFSNREGVVQNTSFALLDPKGKKLTRGSRSPSMTYGSPERFAEALKETAGRYREDAKSLAVLPTVRDLRMALNVAAADMRALVVVRGKDEAAAGKLAERVAAFAWSEEGVGRAHYVTLREAEEFQGLEPELGVSLVQPDPYGLGGEVLVHVSAKASEKRLHQALSEALAKYRVEDREHDDHIREARRRDITWESATPETDGAGARRRRER